MSKGSCAAAKKRLGAALRMARAELLPKLLSAAIRRVDIGGKLHYNFYLKKL